MIETHHLGPSSTLPLPPGDGLAPWQIAWRLGVAPELCDTGLRALRDALKTGDSRLLQSVTTDPAYWPTGKECPPLPIEAACAIGLAGWQGRGLTTTQEVYDFVQRVIDAADDRLEAAQVACDSNDFLDWYDHAADLAPLLAEVELVLAARAGG